MKKQLALLVVLAIAACVAKSQPLFTYGNKSVTKEEFLKAYHKNPTNESDKKKALKEYLDLYINFKLKVQAAYDSNLHKEPTYLYETANFRRQLAENFINEEARIGTLVTEAFNRAQKDIHLVQVFIEAKNEDGATLEKAQKALAELKSGKAIEKVAGEYSSDGSASDLGWITAFTLPYEFENAVYDLKVGEYSEPIKSTYGYHIFKNVSERPAAGRRKVAQVLIAYPQNGTVQEKMQAKAKADSIYYIILNKKIAWEDAVKQFSNDMSSAHNNGQLQEFGIGQYSSAFENAAYSLKTKGDISRPVETNYGFHILQLLEIVPVPKDINDAVSAAVIKEMVEKDDRLTYSKNNLTEKWLKKSNFKQVAFDKAELWQYVDSFINDKSTASFKKIKDSTIIFTYPRQNVKANDFARFYRAAKQAKLYEGQNREFVFNQYIKATVNEYYRNNYENFNSEFAAQVKEFNEANLLFAIMDKMVWGKAGTEEEGLKKYYAQHRNKYVWLPSADVLIVTTTDEKLINELQQQLSSDPHNWRSILQKYNNTVVADSNRYELGQIPVVEKTNFSAGVITSPVKNTDNSINFAYVFKVYRNQEPRNFEDARGAVITDYQSVLEEKWLNELKKRYPVKVNQQVFDSLK